MRLLTFKRLHLLILFYLVFVAYERHYYRCSLRSLPACHVVWLCLSKLRGHLSVYLWTSAWRAKDALHEDLSVFGGGGGSCGENSLKVKPVDFKAFSLHGFSSDGVLRHGKQVILCVCVCVWSAFFFFVFFSSGPWHVVSIITEHQRPLTPLPVVPARSLRKVSHPRKCKRRFGCRGGQGEEGWRAGKWRWVMGACVEGRWHNGRKRLRRRLGLIEGWGEVALTEGLKGGDQRCGQSEPTS